MATTLTYDYQPFAPIYPPTREIGAATVTYTVDGAAYTATVHSLYRYHHRATRTSIFIDGAPDPAWPAPPYGSTRGDGSDEDKAWKRYNREEARIQRTHITAVLAGLGFAEWQRTVRFSRREGCSMCDCSPGWHLIDTLALPALSGGAIYVTVTETPS